MVLWNDISGLPKFSAYYRAPWTLQASARLLQRGDVICLQQNATRPTITRLYQDFSAIFVVAARPPSSLPSEGEDRIWSEVLNRILLLLRDTILIWNWDYTPEEYARLKTYRIWVEELKWEPQDSGTVSHRDETARLFDFGLILVDLRAFSTAQARFQEGIVCFETTIQSATTETALPKRLPLPSLNIHNPSEINPNQQYYRNHTARFSKLLISSLLADAIKEGRQLRAKVIPDSGSLYLSFRDRNGISLLCHAAGGGHLDIVERLHQEHADVNAAAAKREGRTALQAVAGAGYLVIVKRLLQKQADVNAAVAEYRTSLSLLCSPFIAITSLNSSIYAEH